MFSYKPLMHTLLEKNISRSELREAIGIGTGTLAKLGRDEYVSMGVLDAICSYLGCPIEDVVRFIPDGKG